MGERKLAHWSMRILSNLFHVNFWSVMSFFNISHAAGRPLSLALYLGEEVETVLQRHLLQANPFLETGKDGLQKISKVAEG